MAWRCGGQVLAWLAEGREAGASIHGNAVEGANLRNINLSPFSKIFGAICGVQGFGFSTIGLAKIFVWWHCAVNCSIARPSGCLHRKRHSLKKAGC